MTTYNDTLTDPIVQVSVINTQGTLRSTLLDLISALSPIPTPAILIPVNSTLAITEVTHIHHLTHLLDLLTIIESNSNKVSTRDAIIELINSTSSLIVHFNSTITDSLLFTSTFSAYLNSLLELVSSVSITSSEVDKVRYLTSLLNLIGVLDNVGFIDKIVDAIILNSTISNIYRVVNTIIESLVGSSTLLEKHNHILFLSDILNAVSTESTKLTGHGLLEDYFVIYLPEYLDNAKYLAYTLAPETMSVTNYTNYNFTKSTKFNGKYLFSNSTGLYEFGGITDDGVAITSYIQTAGLTFGTSNLKMVPSLYLGYSTDNIVYLKVSVDGKGTVTYKLNKKTDNLGTKLIEIGKGLLGRYFQFELITEADHFDLESIEFLPIKLQRKL